MPTPYLLRKNRVEMTTIAARLDHLEDQMDELKALQGRNVLESRRGREPAKSLREAEFKVFSRFGDDGIIQHLIERLPITERTFIETGIGNYWEANTRFLLVNDNWCGLVIDRNEELIASLEADPLCERHDLTTLCVWLDQDNINKMISRAGCAGSVGIVSLRAEGNEYYLWDALTVASPDVAMVQYNSAFGDRHTISVPYEPAFQRGEAHSSHLYWGCSLPALVALGRRKGYFFAGCNSAGNYAYFVRDAFAGRVPELTVEEGFTRARFRQARNRKGQLVGLGPEQMLERIEALSVRDTETGRLVRIKDLDG